MKKIISNNKEYWDNFYKHGVIKTPSQFCALVASEIDKSSIVIELGSGNGRDSIFLSACGHTVVGIDLSIEAVKECNNNGYENCFFMQGDLTNEVDIAKVVKVGRSFTNNIKKTVFYSRFVLHSLDEVQEDEFLLILNNIMESGEVVYFEFRSIEDSLRKKHYGGHYRRYVDTDTFVKKLVSHNSFRIEYQITSLGMAKYKKEDPYISRVIATKN